MPFGFLGNKPERKEREAEMIKLLEELTAVAEYEDIEDHKVSTIGSIVEEDEWLVNPLIKFLKAKIKDDVPNVEVIALEVLDKCMVEIGYICQHKAKRKILPRVLKMANPKKQYPSVVQDTAKKLIWRWADLYGADDAQLLGYMTAYQELRAWHLFEEEEQHSAVSSDILDSEDETYQI